MIRKYVLSALALVGIAMAIYTVQAGSRPMPAAKPVVPPAKPPYAAYVAGAGMVEASTRNIEIGTLMPGVVARLYVEAGDAVEAGAPLFTLDDRDLRAQLAVREAALVAANAELDKLKALPRPENVPPAE